MSDSNWSQKYLDELNQKLKNAQNSGQQKKTEPEKNVNEKKSSGPVQQQQSNPNRDRFKDKKFRKDKFKGSDKRPAIPPDPRNKKTVETPKVQQGKPVQTQIKPQATFKIKTLNGFVSAIDEKDYYVTADNKEYLCMVQESILRQGPIYMGDRVRITLRSAERGLIDKYEPRQNYIACPSSKGREIVQAANVNQVLLVVSVKEPVMRTDWLDIHLAVCEKRGFKPIICCSKIDLAEDNGFLEQLDTYKRMGYRIIFTSVILSSAMQEIKTLIKNKTTVLTGHAGVGKSALFRALTEVPRATGQVEPEDLKAMWSDDYHETKKTHGIKLDGGGYLIDTPGVSDYEIGGMASKDLKKYFRDFRNYNSQCASLECNHTDESGCKVIEAVKEGEISEDRYQNYLRIIENLSA